MSRTEPNALFWRWVRATTMGWLLGLAIVISLSTVWEVFGGGVQFVVGVGIGAGVGFAQGRVLSAWIGSYRPWLLASTVGMGAPFVVGDVVQAAGVPFPYSLPLYVVVGALVVGLWQSFLLRAVSGRANWWVAACVVGWVVPAAGLALGDAYREGIVGLSSLIVIFLGGAMLGLASGRSITWILRATPSGSSFR